MQHLAADPVLGYTLLACLFLTLVGLAAGLARSDAGALLRPEPAAQLAFAAALAFAVTMLRGTAEGGPWHGPALAALLAAGARLPLHLFALGYGPTAGLAAGGLYVALLAFAGAPVGAPEAVLAFELLLIGWFSIFPSPRAHRWAGPLDAALGATLASLTAGVATLRLAGGPGPAGWWAAWWGEHSGPLAGALLCAAVLFAFGPATYRALFPASRLAPAAGAERAPAADPPTGRGPEREA